MHTLHKLHWDSPKCPRCSSRLLRSPRHTTATTPVKDTNHLREMAYSLSITCTNSQLTCHQHYSLRYNPLPYQLNPVKTYGSGIPLVATPASAPIGSFSPLTHCCQSMSHDMVALNCLESESMEHRSEANCKVDLKYVIGYNWNNSVHGRQRDATHIAICRTVLIHRYCNSVPPSLVYVDTTTNCCRARFRNTCL